MAAAVIRKKRESSRLDSLTVSSLIKNKVAGRHADGGGLYLVVAKNGSAQWSFIFRWRNDRARPGPGKLREMGLGSAQAVPLRRAREKAAEARGLVADGKDPIAHRRADRATPTFGEVADEVIATKSAETTSKASIARWKRSLDVYAAQLRPMRIDAIDTAAVLEVLKPIWLTKMETAQKTRGLIEAVLNAAKARGLRTGENPALWKGHLDHLLPKPSSRVKAHHAAMSRDQIGEFIVALRQRSGASARALEFLIMTAARVSEVTGATWEEVDFKAAIWTVPADRMKSRRPHRVPLPARAMSILAEMKEAGQGRYIFPGATGDGQLSGAAFERLMERMAVDGVTTHGFRSTFRDWAGEVSEFPRDLAEVALAHTVGDMTERAYARGDALEKRRAMMEAWAGFCEAV